MSGWTMPCSRMESASSCRASRAKSLRGWNGQGRTRVSGTRWTRSRESGAGTGSVAGLATAARFAATGDAVAAGGLPANSAPRPRPRAGLDIRKECEAAAGLSTSAAGARKVELPACGQKITPACHESRSGLLENAGGYLRPVLRLAGWGLPQFEDAAASITKSASASVMTPAAK